MAESKDIKYINRDFDNFRNSLIEFSKTYFPTTYNDFSPNSPGSMFIEMASYVGDVLSFYLDNQVQETFLQYARQEPNLYELAYMMGYKPKVTSAALVDIDVYQTVPAKGTAPQVPDFDYALTIAENSSLSSTELTGVSFIMEDSVDFSFSSSLDPTEISIYTTTNGGDDVDTFLLKKKRKAKSSTINTITQTFTEVERYPTITINDSNIIGILDVVDSDGNIWTEVPYLAQETVFNTVRNTILNAPADYTNSDEVPYILRLTKVPRRFVSRFKSKTQLEIQFGAATNPNNINEEITPNPENVGLGLPYTQDKLFTAFDPQNFLHTDTYGVAPSNTTLTVRYLTGGGVAANVESNTINTITGNIKFLKDDLTTSTAQDTFDSLAVINPTAATGGSDGDSVQEIRNNSLGNFGAQLRTITPQDYLTRTLSLPSNLGTVAKAYVEQKKANDVSEGDSALLNLYVLAFNSQKQLINASSTLKTNISTYLSQYRSVGDSIRIKDAFIVNIGIDFDLVILPNYNSNEVISNCIATLQSLFNIDNQQINQPIILKEAFIALDKVEGVQTVNDIKVTNKVGGNYSQYAYDIGGATQNNIIYPSIDPCIFEVKFPDVDIRGRARTF